jgi:hypothetical protein
MMDSNNTVERFLSALNIDIKMQSDPEIIQDILENEMMLSNCQIFMDVFKQEFKEPVDLSPMIQEIQQGLYVSHPAVIEFIQHLNNEGTLTNIQVDHAVIVRMINYIYILNRLVAEGHKYPYWGKEIMEFVFALRKNYRIRENSLYCLIDSYAISKKWFLAVKIASVNFVIKRYLGRLNRNADRTTKNSGYFGQVGWRTLLNINIIEAALGDALSKRWKNAKAGLILVLLNNKKMDTDDTMRFGHSQEWASLYQTWNLSFITTGLPHLDTMFPKLIAPVVANANPDSYMHNRVTALMLTFNWLLIHIKTERKDPMVIINNAELADVWGAINLKYAKKLYKDETGEEFSGSISVCKEYLRRLLSQFRISGSK